MLIVLNNPLTLLPKVTTFKDKFGLTTTAINGTCGGSNDGEKLVRLVEPRTHK